MMANKRIRAALAPGSPADGMSVSRLTGSVAGLSDMRLSLEFSPFYWPDRVVDVTGLISRQDAEAQRPLASRRLPVGFLESDISAVSLAHWPRLSSGTSKRRPR